MRTRAVVLALFFAVTADSPAPEPLSAPVGGGLFRCRLVQIYHVVRPHRGYVPQWIVLAFMSPLRVCG